MTYWKENHSNQQSVASTTQPNRFCHGYITNIAPLKANNTLSSDPLQSNQVKRTPQDSISELIIWKMNPLVVPVTGVKLKAVFLYA